MVKFNIITTFISIIILGKVRKDVFAVQITKLYVPIRASHEAPLDCHYDLEKEQLYDVKWYKDGYQFFRCLPDGKTVKYPLEGIKIVHSNYANIGSCSLTLMMLNKKSNGDYKCEVSTEGPAFKTAVASSKLFIIEVQSSRELQNNTKISNKTGYFESHTTDSNNKGLMLTYNFVIVVISLILLGINYDLF